MSEVVLVRHFCHGLSKFFSSWKLQIVPDLFLESSLVVYPHLIQRTQRESVFWVGLQNQIGQGKHDGSYNYCRKRYTSPSDLRSVESLQTKQIKSGQYFERQSSFPFQISQRCFLAFKWPFGRFTAALWRRLVYWGQPGTWTHGAWSNWKPAVCKSAWPRLVAQRSFVPTAVIPCKTWKMIGQLGDFLTYKNAPRDYTPYDFFLYTYPLKYLHVIVRLTNCGLESEHRQLASPGEILKRFLSYYFNDRFKFFWSEWIFGGQNPPHKPFQLHILGLSCHTPDLNVFSVTSNSVRWTNRVMKVTRFCAGPSWKSF